MLTSLIDDMCAEVNYKTPSKSRSSRSVDPFLASQNQMLVRLGGTLHKFISVKSQSKKKKKKNLSHNRKSRKNNYQKKV